jgi:hypothetical protein
VREPRVAPDRLHHREPDEGRVSEDDREREHRALPRLETRRPPHPHRDRPQDEGEQRRQRRRAEHRAVDREHVQREEDARRHGDVEGERVQLRRRLPLQDPRPPQERAEPREGRHHREQLEDPSHRALGQ